MPAGGALVGVVMGSDSDLPRMRDAVAALDELGVACEVAVISAHRAPRRMADYALAAAGRGLKVIIAGAGAAAHLAGAIAALTTLPVIGVPLATSPLSGMDALLSTVQMPPGVPVATVSVDGARNAGLLAAEILSLADPGLAERLVAQRAAMEASVAAKDERVRVQVAAARKAETAPRVATARRAAAAGSARRSGSATRRRSQP